MAVVSMGKRTGGRENTFYYTESVTTGNTSNVVKISLPAPLTVTVIPTAATATVEFTTSSDAAVEADTATWQDWATGDVTVTTTDALVSIVTAIRMSSAGGTTVLELVQ